MFYVYCYRNPLKDNAIFYIGKGQKKRMYDHLRHVLNNTKSKTYNKHLYYTIQQIISSNQMPIIEKISDNLSECEAYDLERQLIKQYKSQLTNIAEGGTGGDTISNHPNKIAIINKIRKSSINKTHTAETKHRLSINRFGADNPFYNKHHTPENKYKSGSSMRGKKHTAEHIANRIHITQYTILNQITNETLIFNSRKELDTYFKTISQNLPYRKRINYQLILRYTEYKKFKLISMRSIAKKLL